MFTQHRDPSPATTDTTEQLRSSLIMSGLPSTAFTLSMVDSPNGRCVFIRPTFELAGNEFIATRWVWLITYDTRFQATTYNGSKGYALPHRDISAVVGRIRAIDCEPVAAMRTYFADHNMNPDHLTVSLDGEYITMPESETTLTVSYTPQDSFPVEAQNLELDGWDEATLPDPFRHSSDDPQSVSITVAAARDVLREQFGQIDEKYWPTQAFESDLSVSAQ